MPNYNEIDITKNIKIIEDLKCELISAVAELYSAMADRKKTSSDYTYTFSHLLIITYLLSDKLGVSYQSLDTKTINKLKLEILKEENSLEWRDSLQLLAKHLDKNRDLRK